MASLHSREKDISPAGRSFANFYSLMGSVNSARGNTVENRRLESHLSPPGIYCRGQSLALSNLHPLYLPKVILESSARGCRCALINCSRLTKKSSLPLYFRGVHFAEKKKKEIYASSFLSIIARQAREPYATLSAAASTPSESPFLRHCLSLSSLLIILLQKLIGLRANDRDLKSIPSFRGTLLHSG